MSIQSDSVRKADTQIWEFARDNGFTIVSKDSDFCRMALFRGASPKVIWLVVGNADTEVILRFLNDHQFKIVRFIRDPEESLLILEHEEAET